MAQGAEIATAMNQLNSSVTENFSLIRGGPFHRVLAALRQTSDERHKVIARAVGAVVICWLPLLVLSLVQGVAFGPSVKIPFLSDYVVHLRFLIALPILILAESSIDRRWRRLAAQFVRTRLVREEEVGQFEGIVQRITRLRDNLLPEAVMLPLAFAAPLFLGHTEVLMSGITNWHVGMAAAWFRLVSAPFFRFLLLRWIWRMCMWTLFVARVSRLRLYLVATHTDLAGGLGFLSDGQKAYGPIVFAGGTVIAGSVMNAIRYEGHTLSSLRTAMIAYGVMAVLVLVVPLLVVTPLLIKVKRKALWDYGGLVTEHNQLFDTKWIGGGRSRDETILGNPDASSLVDLGGSFAVIRQMGIVPVDKPTLITLALAAALPMIPVVLLVTPSYKILHAILKMLG